MVLGALSGMFGKAGGSCRSSLRLPRGALRTRKRLRERWNPPITEDSRQSTWQKHPQWFNIFAFVGWFSLLKMTKKPKSLFIFY